MQWYEGSIPAAIAEAKEKKKIFLVYIEGKDELSKQMTATYDDKVVSEKLESEGCVSIKLEADSDSCKQFSQIYPICIIPSSFFIGNDGIPLEVIAGNLEPDKFLSKVDKVIKLHSGQATDDQSKTKKENQDACGSGAIPKETHVSSAGETHVSSAGETHMSAAGLNTDTTSTASLNTDTTSTYALTTYQVSTATQEKNSEDDVEMSSPTNAAEEEVKQSTSSQADAEEFEQKVKRARRLIEERNVQKEEEAQKKENEKEVERRKAGKDIQKTQRQRELNELQEWAQDRAKEKEEERIAREKVLAQIAQDRAERAARYQQSIKKKAPEQPEMTDGERKSEQDTATTDALSRSQFANIQFRLPDGTSVIHQFSADSTLEEAQQYINENIKPGYSQFTLSTTFPRREFTRNDYSQSLRDLQLVPSSTVLILPVHSITRSDGGGLAALLWSVLSPFAVIWGYITSFFSSSNSASTSSNSSAPQQTTSTSTNDNDKRAEGDSKTIPRRNFYHQEGNVYRLSNQQGDDDDNNTWNGNSTQQM